MALFEWSEDYSTHIRVIDDDHKNLFSAVNALHDAHVRDKGRERIGSVIETLKKYAVEHFDREERFMEHAGFPGIEAHRLAHREFAHLVESLRILYRKSPETVNVEKVLDYLGGWLKGHIVGDDKKYIPYVRGEVQGVRAVSASGVKQSADVTLSFSVPADKADVIRDFVSTVTARDGVAAKFESAFRKALKDKEDRTLVKARKLFCSSH